MSQNIRHYRINKIGKSFHLFLISTPNQNNNTSFTKIILLTFNKTKKCPTWANDYFSFSGHVSPISKYVSHWVPEINVHVPIKVKFQMPNSYRKIILPWKFGSTQSDKKLFKNKFESYKESKTGLRTRDSSINVQRCCETW